jgi:hypothetical protein
MILSSIAAPAFACTGYDPCPEMTAQDTLTVWEEAWFFIAWMIWG